MAYEIDYIPVGEGEKSGDAIALRFGNFTSPQGKQTVVTIDGGTLESGDALVDLVVQHYGTTVVDYAILTHPDGDHAHGMRRILERLTVRTLVMHLPWEHSENVKALVDDDRATVPSLSERAKKNLEAAYEIFKLANAKGNINIVEPFAGVGTQDGTITILGPTEEFYQRQLANFKFNPGTPSLVETLLAGVKKVASYLIEAWHLETLVDPLTGSSSPENNSSAIILFKLDGQNLLFTGDAGVSALTAACNFSEEHGIALTPIQFFHVPHHGSRRNIGPTILNRLFGNIRPSDDLSWTAFISAAKDGAPKHPNKKVTNALRRRGASVHATAGISIRHQNGAPPRLGYQPITPIDFYNRVEDDNS